MSLYPLKFEPIYKPKVWGGRSLERLGRDLPGEEPIGESWELADLSATSVSGGGGGAERSVVANGPLAGRTINEVMDAHERELMDGLPRSPFGDFPLLVKFLDARENLSVQVHPSPEYAAEHDDAHLKSEAWYIVECEPGAVIYKGIKEGVTPEQFRAAIADETVEELLIAVPVEPGQVHYLPSGTCHALGAGIVVAEVQTPSDTTFRVYDWGREGRELHIAPALQCMRFGPAATARYEPHTRNEREQTVVEGLVRCEYFHLDRVRMTAGYRQELTDREPVVWMVLAGSGRVICGGEGPSEMAISRGETLLLPAAMETPRISVDEDLTLLEVRFPQANGDLLA